MIGQTNGLNQIYNIKLMKLKEIIKNIDISHKYECNSYDLCSTEFDIHEYLNQPNDFKLFTVRISKAYCTDTWVGKEILYFENKPVCLINQPYRKASKEYEWFSKKDFLLVRKYILSLREEIISEPTIIDLETEMGEGETMYEFSSYILQDEVIYTPTKELVKVINTKPLQRQYGLDKELLVQFKNGKEEIVSMFDITLPWLLNSKTIVINDTLEI